MKIPSISEFMKEGLSLSEAQMAIEAMSSACLEGAKPISAKRMVYLMKKNKREEMG